SLSAAAACLTVVLGVMSPAVGLGLVTVVLTPYCIVLGVRPNLLRRFGLPAAWADWITVATIEEEAELEVAIHPSLGNLRDAIIAGVAVLVVVGASIAMEQSLSELGARHGFPEIIIGGIVLAAVTSLPNAVAAVYLAARGRGAATLSIAMNSNT